MNFPIYLKSKNEKMFICLDDEYRFIRIDKHKTSTHFHYSIQFGLNYAYHIEPFTKAEQEREFIFIKRFTSLNTEITEEEFFSELNKYDEQINEYKNFFEINKKVYPEEIIHYNEYEEQNEELNF